MHSVKAFSAVCEGALKAHSGRHPERYSKEAWTRPRTTTPPLRPRVSRAANPANQTFWSIQKVCGTEKGAADARGGRGGGANHECNNTGNTLNCFEIPDA